MDIKTQQIMLAHVLPTRRDVAENSQETGDSISLEGDMDVDYNIRENKIYNPSVGSQVITTIDGYGLNAILAGKLHTEGHLNVQEELNSSEKPGKRKRIEIVEDLPIVKKKKASPIVFDVDKKVEETERAQETFEGAHSVTVNTVTNTNKYNAVAPLDAERQLVWCRLYPACRYGSACAFAHPRCRFLAACARPDCIYSHSPNAPSAPKRVAHPVRHTAPRFASRVAVNKFGSAGTRRVCKFHPNCLNPGCYFKHPKACRYGKNCANKLTCIFYHAR